MASSKPGALSMASCSASGLAKNAICAKTSAMRTTASRAGLVGGKK